MRDSVDVLLVNPGDVMQVYQNLSAEFSAIELPVYCAMFAGMLRNGGYSVAILDVPADGLSAEKAAIVAASYNPKLIAVVVYGFQPSASTQNMPSARKICKYLKEINRDCKIFITGTHPAALPQRTLTEEAVDFVGTSDGIVTLPLLAEAVKNNAKDFGKVPGICYWGDDGEKCSTEQPALVRSLDEVVPNLAFDLLPMDKYRAHNWHCFDDVDSRMPYASIHTTLGCPYQCSFCCINTPFSGPNYSFGPPSYRMWKPETVIGWIDALVRDYGVRNLKIVDEMFVLNKRHVFGICDLIIERGYDLNIWAYARVDTAKEEFLEKTRSAGIRWYALGIESGSKHVRDGADKALKNEDILSVIKRIQGADINVIGNYIFGLPDDDFNTMQETLDLAVEANCEFANFYSAMAYPGSPLYVMAKERGYLLPDDHGGPGWIGYSQHSYETLPLPTDFVGAKEVLAFRDYAFLAYFTNPRYLELIRNRFGYKAAEHVGRMSSLPPLRRKLLEK